jgi:hypothetical protein
VGVTGQALVDGRTPLYLVQGRHECLDCMLG